MKGLIQGAFLVLCATIIIAVMPTEAEAEIYRDTVRLHILAASDSEEDQNLKYAVRDALITEYGDRLSQAENPAEARALSEALLPEIEDFVNRFIRESGFAYGARVTLSIEWYDTREYGDFSMPAGYYTSLRVIIGEGEGQNWWCVMYPPLCTELATESAPRDDAVIDYTKEEISLIKSKKYNVKFKSLEIISRAFRKK